MSNLYENVKVEDMAYFDMPYKNIVNSILCLILSLSQEINICNLSKNPVFIKVAKTPIKYQTQKHV